MNQFPGLIEPGNVDLFAQPSVPNPDGTASTVDSRSFNFDGREVLLPSVTPDGRHLRTDEEIIAEYKRTRRHLGMFADVQSANAYAEQLHRDYEAGKYRRPRGPGNIQLPNETGVTDPRIALWKKSNP